MDEQPEASVQDVLIRELGAIREHLRDLVQQQAEIHLLLQEVIRRDSFGYGFVAVEKH